MMENATDLSRALGENAEAFCRAWLPNGRKMGNHWVVGNKHGEPGRSLAVRLRAAHGRLPGKWNDRATGEHGDLIDIIREQLPNSSWGSVFSEARRFLGRPELAPSPYGASSQQAPSSNDRIAAARKLFAIG